MQGGKTSPLNPAEHTDHAKLGARPEDKFLSPKAAVKECVWGLTRGGDMQGKPNMPNKTINLKHGRQTHLQRERLVSKKFIVVTENTVEYSALLIPLK